MWIKTVYSPRSLLSFNTCSLEGQSTGKHEVQYRTTIKRGKGMKYSPPRAQLLLTHPPQRVLCLHKSKGTETLTLLREGNYSCTVRGENPHAKSASSWDCAGVRKKNAFKNTEGPSTTCMTAPSPTHVLGAAGEAWEPLQSTIQEPPRGHQAQGPQQEQGGSKLLINIHQGLPCSLPPACTRRDFSLVVEHPGKRAQFQMSCNFPGLSFKAENLRKAWMFVTFLSGVWVLIQEILLVQQAAQKREHSFACADTLSRTQEHIVKYLLWGIPQTSPGQWVI